jgi:hypothetical protein
MTMNPLPPQAYTKDTLLKAYQWLMGQNSSIKEIATNPDILVSLYLKATRDGDHALERPSIQNFKNELRSLAGMMGDLERSPSSNTHSQHNQHSHSQPHVQQHVSPMGQQLHLNQAIPMQQPMPVHNVSPSHHHHYQQAPQAHPTAHQPHVQVMPPSNTSIAHAASLAAAAATSSNGNQSAVMTTTTTSVAVTAPAPLATLDDLDEGTREMIQEVKDDFNLSSDREALRMLIKIGHTRAKGMLKS